MNETSPATTRRRYRVELITAESEASLLVRHRRLIRFPQLTMPLLAAWTPEHWEVSHTDEIVQRVDFNKRVDLVGHHRQHARRPARVCVGAGISPARCRGR
jgi:hypothetical protein